MGDCVSGVVSVGGERGMSGVTVGGDAGVGVSVYGMAGRC